MPSLTDFTTSFRKRRINCWVKLFRRSKKGNYADALVLWKQPLDEEAEDPWRLEEIEKLKRGVNSFERKLSVYRSSPNYYDTIRFSPLPQELYGEYEKISKETQKSLINEEGEEKISKRELKYKIVIYRLVKNLSMSMSKPSQTNIAIIAGVNQKYVSRLIIEGDAKGCIS